MQAVVLDQAHWSQLVQVQNAVNDRVRFESDQASHHVDDFWTPALGVGDCEDIALAKRDSLLALGWPARVLRMALATDEQGGLHAVLTVDAKAPDGRRATYVLDNRFIEVQPWQVLTQYGYKWISRYKPGKSKWTEIR